MLTKKKVITGILLTFGILVIINFFAYRFFLRLDFTADQEYTLSKATKNILKSLVGPSHVTVFY